MPSYLSSFFLQGRRGHLGLSCGPRCVLSPLEMRCEREVEVNLAGTLVPGLLAPPAKHREEALQSFQQPCLQDFRGQGNGVSPIKFRIK